MVIAKQLQSGNWHPSQDCEASLQTWPQEIYTKLKYEQAGLQAAKLYVAGVKLHSKISTCGAFKNIFQNFFNTPPSKRWSPILFLLSINCM